MALALLAVFHIYILLYLFIYLYTFTYFLFMYRNMIYSGAVYLSELFVELTVCVCVT